MTFKLLSTFTVLGGLLGCSALPPLTSESAQASAAERTQRQEWPRRTGGAALVDSIYGLARQAHGSGHLGIAGARYERVLSLQADHPGALNGLGVIRAQDGRTLEARELFRRVSVLTPQAAHVHNNLGYLLLREDQLDEAETALQRAHALEPDSAQTVQNLARLAEARGNQTGTPAAQPEPPGQAPAVVVVAPNIFELRLPATPPTSVATPAGGATPLPPLALQTVAPVMKLEISNGVGTPRLATRTARRLTASGVATSRLTNALPYRQALTQIQYLPGQEAAVQALMDRLPVSVERLQVASLGGRVDIRLVLGHDLAGRTIAGWAADTGSTQVAAPLPAERSGNEQPPPPAMAHSRPS